jgi:hypothetical protein
MLFSRFAQSAAAFAILTVGFAAPVHAQFNKQIISGTWYEDRAGNTTNSSPTLDLAFTQTPSDKYLNITNVSCSITVTSAELVTGMSIQAGTTSGSVDILRTYPIMGSATPVTSGTSRYYNIVQNGIFFKFGPGRFPTVEIDTATTGASSVSAGCVIVGNLTDN